MKQGMIKSISVTEVIDGMQVIDQVNQIGKIENKSTRYSDGSIAYIPKELLKTLVIEYEDNETNISKSIDRIRFKQLPLKHSQWQQAIDDGLVDSDKVVEFNILLSKTIDKVRFPDIAELTSERAEKFKEKYSNPQKKRMYSEEEMIQAINDFMFGNSENQRYKTGFIRDWIHKTFKSA